MADLDILSEHSKSLLDGMVVDIVNVQQQLKALPAEMARMLAEQNQQLNAMTAAHVQRLSQLSASDRAAQAAALAQGVELLNNIVDRAKELIEGQSKKERGESFYQLKAVRDDALADLKAELGKVDGVVAGIKNSLAPALANYSQKLGEAAEATAQYCTVNVIEADKRTAGKLKEAALSAMQNMTGQLWAFIGVGAFVWLIAGGVGAWAVVKALAH